ncbi:hypothetical protein [Ottowia sp.]|uniref:hypothetical protein n=1 Tax=Ottowia sp. TaxID=1898956 RepID=UPI002B73B776|nr:hypothetical protein [Ottowia sp.]HOB67109.1 hypothetical protein [Ottowia sp.]HPZ56645.1 hypothetical protein [Ottowia sp.]HQD47110.1 hypothetical protein [Ottowia sp.]
MHLLTLAVLAFAASMLAQWLVPPEPFWARPLLTGVLVFFMDWGVRQVWPIRTQGAQK